MPRNSSGNYQSPASSWNPAINGSLATAGDWNVLLADLSAALTDSLSRGGNGSMSANLNMGNNRITNLAAGIGSGDAATWQQLFGVGVMADIASAATVDIGIQNTSFLRVTGTTTITSFGTNYRGPRFITFEGIVTLTNSSTLILPGNANITTAAGDSLIVIPGATAGTADKWVVVAYQKNAVPGFTPNGSITTEKIANNAITPAKLANGGLELGGFRNRIINGDMRIDARNNGASVTIGTTTNTYTLDRWAVESVAGSKFSVQQSTAAPAGFTNSLLVTSLAATSVGSTDYYSLRQRIEGFNTADLGWGAAGAQTVTLSFWVRSSLTGTFGGVMTNSANNRSYPFSYSISAANTWEQKTVMVAGDTTGTWLTNNGVGISVYFSLGMGSTYSGMAGAWVAAERYSVTGATNLIATNGATFYITGVQLEAGSVATPFERRPYGTELALCQRYYYEGVAPTGVASGSTSINSMIVLPVEMRATPSVNKTAGTFGFGDLVSAGFTTTSTPTLQDVVLTNLNKLYRFSLGGFSGLTQYRTYAHEAKFSTTALITLSAEL